MQRFNIYVFNPLQGQRFKILYPHGTSLIWEGTRDKK
jgi:hypothetical protein